MAEASTGHLRIASGSTRRGAFSPVFRCLFRGNALELASSARIAFLPARPSAFRLASSAAMRELFFLGAEPRPLHRARLLFRCAWRSAACVRSSSARPLDLCPAPASSSALRHPRQAGRSACRAAGSGPLGAACFRTACGLDARLLALQRAGSGVRKVHQTQARGRGPAFGGSAASAPTGLAASPAA
jgi:hypothetical protein